LLSPTLSYINALLHATVASLRIPHPQLTIEFDNSGRRVMSEENDKKIRQALGDKVFFVPLENVILEGGIGQSTLLNQQAIAVYKVYGVAKNDKSLCENCQVS
jgi:hypothetical protein